ncbi:hypothetical protein ACP8Y2_21440 [Herpetosiphon llansteffanensis]
MSWEIGFVTFGSILGLIIILWIFSRLAWGGGMQQPSYDLLNPTKERPISTQFAQPDQESIVVRCKQCNFSHALPEISKMPAFLASVAQASNESGELKSICPHCEGVLQSWIRQAILHQGSHQVLEFAVLRRGQRRLYEIETIIYSSLSEIPQPQRGLVAEALNEPEPEEPV